MWGGRIAAQLASELSRPGFGPPTEPARSITSVAASRWLHLAPAEGLLVAAANAPATASARGPGSRSLLADPLGAPEHVRGDRTGEGPEILTARHTPAN